MAIKILIMLGGLLAFLLILWRPYQRKLPIKKNKKNSELTKLLYVTDTPQLTPQQALFSSSEAGPIEEAEDIPADFFDFKLLSGTNVDEKKKVLTQITTCFRKPHPLLIPLLRTSFDSHELYDLVKSDPELTAQILKVVNSPLLSLRQSITNINHAIVFLGVVQVKNIAVQLAVQNNKDFSNPQQNVAYKNIWSASYMASSLCFLLAKHMGKGHESELSTYCLLSYLGDQALLSYEPSLAVNYLEDSSFYQRVKSTQELVSTNSAVIGRILSEQWNLPRAVIKGIGRNLLPFTDLCKNKYLSEEDLKDILLCYIACRLGDLVIFNGLRDISQIGRLDGALGLEFYYLQDNLRQLGMGQVNDILLEAAFTQKANKQIGQIFSPS